MHTDDHIHRILIGAMIAERQGQPEVAARLIQSAATLHIQGYIGRPSYFGTPACATSGRGVIAMEQRHR